METADTALAVGLAALKVVNGKTWVFGSNSFIAWRSRIRIDDPRTAGMPKRAFMITCMTADLPTPAPERGSSLTLGSELFLCNDAWRNGNGTTTILLT